MRDLAEASCCNDNESMRINESMQAVELGAAAQGHLSWPGQAGGRCWGQGRKRHNFILPIPQQRRGTCAGQAWQAIVNAMSECPDQHGCAWGLRVVCRDLALRGVRRGCPQVDRHVRALYAARRMLHIPPLRFPARRFPFLHGRGVRNYATWRALLPV